MNWTFRINGTWVVTPTTTLLGNWFYRAPMKFEQGEFSRFTNANFTIRQKLQGDKLVATLRFADPFKQNKFSVKVSDDNVIQFTDRAFSMRAVFLGLNYTFGQTPRLRQRRQDEQPQTSTPFGS